ncbi:MAG: mannose-1-phosphate guanylyltransferase, partial [Acidimicrobiia bacterium]|nr:mannose-1-phosphate guanylyltransferase [Acidimicrobiia bacterium]
MIIPVILSGGSGTRLWPVSRRATPKQFQALQGSDTMLQATAGRLAALPEVAPPIVVCNRSHADQVTSQLIEVGPTVILEPAGRNTAPAVAAACHVAFDMDPEAVVVVLPSDHVIGDVAAFASMVETAVGLAGDGRLVTFGVVPTGPATGYGYIKPGDALTGAGHSIGAFVEKPDEATAAGYVAAGYLWNSGMFVFRAGAYLSELERLQPEMAVAVADAVNNSVRT